MELKWQKWLQQAVTDLYIIKVLTHCTGAQVNGVPVTTEHLWAPSAQRRGGASFHFEIQWIVSFSFASRSACDKATVWLCACAYSFGPINHQCERLHEFLGHMWQPSQLDVQRACEPNVRHISVTISNVPLPEHWCLLKMESMEFRCGYEWITLHADCTCRCRDWWGITMLLKTSSELIQLKWISTAQLKQDLKEGPTVWTLCWREPDNSAGSMCRPKLSR